MLENYGVSLVRNILVTIYLKTLHICLRKLNTSILFASLSCLVNPFLLRENGISKNNTYHRFLF